MASRTRIPRLLALIVLVTGCKVPEASSPTTPAPASESTGATASTTPSAAAPGAPATASSGAPPPSSDGTTPPGPDSPPPSPNERPGPPLPELRVKSFGLHVGGAAKDIDQRREVQRTLERGFPRYLDCYRLIDEPGSEGTFGADLRVAAEGGKAKVLQPRTGLKGEAFRACMIKAFESARFDPPSSGRALVVSYSVKFSFGW